MRYPSPIEPYSSYLPFLSWPVMWLLPYGYWTWVLAFSPEIASWLLARLRPAPSARSVSVRKTGSGVELVDGAGQVVEQVRDADVEAVTRLVDSSGRTTALRVGRKGGCELLFETGADDVKHVARALGLDLKKARGRYRTGSRAAALIIFLFVGFGIIAWSIVSPPSDEQIAWMFALYHRWIMLPLVVMFAIPTWVDVGVDGVAWKWLFVRRYFPFASMAEVVPVQRGGKSVLLRLLMREGSESKIWLTKESGPRVVDPSVRAVFDAVADGVAEGRLATLLEPVLAATTPSVRAEAS